MHGRHRIVTFHGLGTPPRWVEGSEQTVWVDRDLFEATLDEAARLGDDVAITFDDGNRSDVEIALPALRERRLKGTFFVVAERIGDPRYLGADDLRELVAAGMGVGSHGLEHRSWRTLDDELLKTHLERARSMLEETTGSPVTEASCPFGEYDRRVLGHLRRSGHERVYTSDGGPTSRDGWLQARTTVGSDWGPPAACLVREDAPTERLLRVAKRTVKRWR